MTMDFRQVKLGQFANAKLHDNSQPQAAEIPEQVKPADSTELVAEAPQFVMKVVPYPPEILSSREQVLSVSVDVSGHFLAVMQSRIYIWKHGARNVLAFPVSSNHSVHALFVPTNSNEPGLVVADQVTGVVSYWYSLSRAVMDLQETSQGTNGGTQGSHVHAQIHLKSNEQILHLEPVFPVGIIISTSNNNFYLLNLRDETGKSCALISKLNFNSNMFPLFRSLGPFAKNVSSIKPGAQLPDRTRELFIVNKDGDLAKWKIGLNGFAEHIDECRAGSLIHMNMNMLYPNSKISLLVHDLAIETTDSEELVHVLASFEPIVNSELRYLVIATLNSDLELLTVQRLQAYESHDPKVLENSKLEVVNKVLCVVCDDALAMVDSVTFGILPRWEECVYLKRTTKVVNSMVINNTIVVPTSLGALTIEFISRALQLSTTKARLEQAVFNSREDNPLDLLKWSSFEYTSDENAARDLAFEIANSESKYLPHKLPNLLEHLRIRRDLLIYLYKLEPRMEVKELAQCFVAAYTFYEVCSTEQQNNNLLVDINASVGDLRDLLYTNPQKISDLLADLALKTDVETNQCVVLSLKACLNSQLGMPQFATHDNFIKLLKSLAVKAVDGGNAAGLKQLLELLCAIFTLTSDLGSSDATNAETISLVKDLCEKLSELNDPLSAKMIAMKYKVFAALAPLEVNEWLATNDINVLQSHLEQFGLNFQNEVFSYLVKSKNSERLVFDLAPLNQQAVLTFLIENNLPQLAWTINIESRESNNMLKTAALSANTVETRQVYASLFKLSSNINTTASGAHMEEANELLDLVHIQTDVIEQLKTSRASSSAILESELSSLDSVITRGEAIDMLALAPAQALPELNLNFVRGFKLLKPGEDVRLRLLVMQLIRNTNWKNLEQHGDEQKIERFKRSLYYSSYKRVPEQYKQMLKQPFDYLNPPNVDEIHAVYPWDVQNKVPQDFYKLSEIVKGHWDQYSIDDYLNYLD